MFLLKCASDKDKNRDGISQKEELTPFTDAHIAALLTAFSQGAQWDSSNINHNERGHFICEDSTNMPDLALLIPSMIG